MDAVKSIFLPRDNTLESLGAKLSDSERVLRIFQFSLVGMQVIIPGFREIHVGKVIKVVSLINGAAEIRSALIATFFVKDIKEVGDGSLVTRSNWSGNYKKASFMIANLIWPMVYLHSWNMIPLNASARHFSMVCYACWMSGSTFELIEASNKCNNWTDPQFKKALADFTFNLTQIVFIEQTPQGIKAIGGIVSGYYGLSSISQPNKKR